MATLRPLPPEKPVRQRLPYAERRAQLLTVARDIVAEGGLAALTMAGLADRAAIAKPVVYTHFASSRHVAIALLDAHFAAINDLFTAQVSAALDLDVYLDAVVEAAFAFETVSETPIRKITSGASAGDDIDRVFHTHEARFRDHWRHLLVLLGMPWEHTSGPAVILAAMVAGALTNRLAGRDADDRRSLKTMLTAAIDAERERFGADRMQRSFAEPIYRQILHAQAALSSAEPKQI